MAKHKYIKIFYDALAIHCIFSIFKHEEHNLHRLNDFKKYKLKIENEIL